MNIPTGPLRATQILLGSTLILLTLLVPVSHAADSRNLLGKLRVAPEKSWGYKRSLFPHWINVNGCDTRQAVLRRQNSVAGASCRARSGRWFSAFDGLRFTNSSDLDVDHFVPLAEAWRSGARRWNRRTRTRFANDLYGYSLLAVSASSNRSKGDRDPSGWLPPRSSFRCAYVARWVAIKYRWRLRTDSKEKRAILGTMRGCSRKSLQVKKIKRAPVSRKKNSSGGGKLDPRFPTCSAAKAAGYGPYRRGRDPEYHWYRDADGDGIVCE
jgi:hypothetical protein